MTARHDHKHLLAFAEKQSQISGQRWTEIRAQVYESLLRLGRPASAYQLLEEVACRYKRAVKPASIYRSLEALASIGVVAKIESLNSFVACRHPEHSHQHVFLVCDHCGQIDEIADQGISGQLSRDAARKGFRAYRQVLELHGDCKTCQK